MPSIEGGGVEKNLFLITNHLSGKFNNNITLITASKKFKNKFNKIEFISPSLNLSNFGRKIKYLFCLYELMKLIIWKRETYPDL